MNAFFAITGILAVAKTLPLSEVDKEWENFKLVYGKQYENQDEENMRKEIFAENLYKFEEHNKKYAAGLVSHVVGVNRFADMTFDEFLKTLTPIDPASLTGGLPFVPPANVEVPESIDWRQQNAVTAVKDQGQCGSCYAFTATGALEGQIAIKTGNLISLSEQNLVDCTIAYDNQGCEKGSVATCFNYIQANGGIDTEESYRYEDAVGDCRYTAGNSAATNNGFVNVPANDEGALQIALATVGPVAVLINAESFNNYTEGVIVGDCNPNQLNHFVLVVGYDTDSDGQDYWIVKNSWGENFKQDGYALMARNQNQCGIATAPTYPIV